MQLIMGCMETVATMARWRNTPFAPQVLVTCPEVVDDQTARDMAWIHSSWLTWAQRSERLAETWRKTSQTIRHPRKAAGRLGDRLLAAIERNSGWAIDVAPFYRD
ncbi:MAG: hypothetical protein COW24_03080 [Candidatus Kerfeldbacteria bacterium CG15_BIG_FIL_POST_REV_8_21_14_020_45_12]|uniref:Uncharacterized protein n=1 Tax=Candidatus Kerfeldbacteria bacterium CG15_BIG_FIL_POST_REV_8_21_14_020_45_12 TaxID=2014247 RepID=A0A2M7H3W0_9BACT|nr:MAG: hypothetical protein COW24_03080 [Candidatus Kerfeldbacteria bacterium CG15_BIG_FIL_POST_REV_8_21_14_020_45_12]PJA92998.1 MAG: hypothetical protein CO132_05120 [Candidatus Kerfeldbacteria bacterium CG_4_9_14_3_um_filter_45_8]